MAAYEPMIPAGEVPDYFIYLTVDPSAIDVNIHPTKTEIKFENEKPIWQILSSTVRETLGKVNAFPSIDFNSESAIEIPVYNPSAAKRNISPPQVDLNLDYNPFHFPSNRPSFLDQSREQLFEDFENDGCKGEMQFTPTNYSPDSLSLTTNQLPLTTQSPCFQYNTRYIITSLKSGLVLIDQHRAHVRILYEQYISNIKLQKSVSQQVLFPEIVEFSPSEAALIPSLREEIEWLGFDLSPMGANCYAINGVPAGVRDCNPAILIKEIIQEVMEHAHNDVGRACVERTKKIELLALSLAKSAAIRPGKSLTIEEMESIAASLFSLESNNLTPDGKPIMTVILDDELNKRFL
jgi:DNA mismatch repair protein MutL